MGNKFKDSHNIDESAFSVTKNEDYCSFCGGWKSSMLNHKIAHKLKIKADLELSFFWYVQDISRPIHLRSKDSRLDNYLEKQTKYLAKSATK